MDFENIYAGLEFFECMDESRVRLQRFHEEKMSSYDDKWLDDEALLDYIATDVSLTWSKTKWTTSLKSSFQSRQVTENTSQHVSTARPCFTLL
jgi:hypothetical protein